MLLADTLHLALRAITAQRLRSFLTLLAALDTLQAALGELEFTHNNLKETNLRWHRGRFVPIRYYDARIGTAELGTGDREAFAALRHRIAEAPAPRQTANDVTAHYNPLRSLTGHRWTSHVFEGLVCVEDDNGFGFVDTDNNPVIPAQFVWAGDFREGRAEVQTQTGMGLIDRRGCYVIPPEYEIVDYDPAASVVHVRNNGHWALFDYLGRGHGTQHPPGVAKQAAQAGGGTAGVLVKDDFGRQAVIGRHHLALAEIAALAHFARVHQIAFTAHGIHACGAALLEFVQKRLD